MRKMIPVYVLLTAILGVCVLFGFLVLHKAELMRVDIAAIKGEQVKTTPLDRPSRFGPTMRVEVVNTPRVEVDGTVDVEVVRSKTLDVDVRSMP